MYTQVTVFRTCAVEGPGWIIAIPLKSESTSHISGTQKERAQAPLAACALNFKILLFVFLNLYDLAPPHLSVLSHPYTHAQSLRPAEGKWQQDEMLLLHISLYLSGDTHDKVADRIVSHSVLHLR